MTNTIATIISTLRALADQEIGDRADAADSLIDDLVDDFKEGDGYYDFLLLYSPIELRDWLTREINENM